MTDTRTQPELDIAVPPTKRAAIESELRNDADRSDREIARVVGCDHKTVAARRREMGIASPLGNSPPPSPDAFRDMLVKGTEDFDAKYPQESAGACVDRMIAEGKISYATAGSGGQGASKDDCSEFDWSTDDAVVVKEQRATAIYINKLGDLVIRQKAEWDEDCDSFIYISETSKQRFLDKLCDVMNVPSLP